MEAKTALNTVVKVIVYVLLVLVLLGVVGFILRFTNGGTTELKTFYLELSGETVTRDTTVYLRKDKPLKVVPKYTFGEISDLEGYSYKIVPRVTEETQFYFEIGTDSYSFSAIEEVTNAFKITEDEAGFIIENDFETDNAVKHILERQYENEVICEVTKANEIVYFDLLVYSYDGSQCYTIGLLFPINVTDLILDKSEVIL